MGAWVRPERTRFGVQLVHGCGYKWLFKQKQDWVGSYKLQNIIKESVEKAGTALFYTFVFLLYMFNRACPLFWEVLLDFIRQMEDLQILKGVRGADEYFEYLERGGLQLEIKSCTQGAAVSFMKLGHNFNEKVLGAINWWHFLYLPMLVNIFQATQGISLFFV